MSKICPRGFEQLELNNNYNYYARVPRVPRVTEYKATKTFISLQKQAFQIYPSPQLITPGFQLFCNSTGNTIFNFRSRYFAKSHADGVFG